MPKKRKENAKKRKENAKKARPPSLVAFPALPEPLRASGAPDAKKMQKLAKKMQ